MTARLISTATLVALCSSGAHLACARQENSSDLQPAPSLAGAGGEPSGGESGGGSGPMGSGATGSAIGGAAGGGGSNAGGSSAVDGQTSGSSGGASIAGGASGGGPAGAAGGSAAGGAGAAGASGGATVGGASGSAGTTGQGCGTGCALLSAPLSAAGSYTTAQIAFATANLTGVTVTLRACKITGDANSVLQLFVQQGPPSYSGNYSTGLYKSFDNVKTCGSGMSDLTSALAAEGAFDPVSVSTLTVKILANGTTGPWVSTQLYIDSISVTGNVVGPWSFTNSTEGLNIVGGSVAGSSLAWSP